MAGPTITADPSPIFPECPGFNFTVEPRYLVKAIEREGGYERVDRRWSRPLCFFTAVPTGNREASVVQTILAFWHGVGGQSGEFRFKDYTDFKTCQVQDDPGTADQPLEVVDGSHWQLLHVQGLRHQHRLQLTPPFCWSSSKRAAYAALVGHELGVD